MTNQKKLFEEDRATNYKDYFEPVTIYQPKLKNIFDSIKYLNYQDYLEFKDDFMRAFQVLRRETLSHEAKQKAWERIVLELEQQFGYKKPQSTSSAAERMRKYRAKN